MRTIKSAVTGLMILALSVLFLSACGQRKTTIPEERLIRVGFSQVGSESDWRMANTASMTAALSEANGFELIFDNAKQRQENQLLAIRKRQWHPTPVLLPGKSHGRRSLEGCSPWGR